MLHSAFATFPSWSPRSPPGGDGRSLRIPEQDSVSAGRLRISPPSTQSTCMLNQTKLSNGLSGVKDVRISSGASAQIVLRSLRQRIANIVGPVFPGRSCRDSLPLPAFHLRSSFRLFPVGLSSFSRHREDILIIDPHVSHQTMYCISEFSGVFIQVVD